MIVEALVERGGGMLSGRREMMSPLTLCDDVMPSDTLAGLGCCPRAVLGLPLSLMKLDEA